MCQKCIIYSLYIAHQFNLTTNCLKIFDCMSGVIIRNTYQLKKYFFKEINLVNYIICYIYRNN